MSQVVHSDKQTILTYFLPPTNFKGSRIVAKCEARRRIYSWDHSLGSEQNHAEAADRLIHELGWNQDDDKWIGGWVRGTGYVWVCVDE